MSIGRRPLTSWRHGRRPSLERDLVDLAVRYDRLGDGATAIPATYVQSVMRLAG